MYLESGRTYLRRFLIALVLTLAIGGVGLAASSAISWIGERQSGSQIRSSVPVTEAYWLRFRMGNAEFRPLRISEQGAECVELRTSEALYEACNLAVNTDLNLIAGDARGRLNLEYTAAFEAIVWRSRFSLGPEGCNLAGLQGAWLEDCRQRVRTTGPYDVRDSGLTVRLD